METVIMNRVTEIVFGGVLKIVEFLLDLCYLSQNAL